MSDVDPIVFDQSTTRALIEAISRAVLAHTDELTALDRAIGDADHGVNLERGFNAVLAEIDRNPPSALGPGLSAVGRTLIMAVGGASGPLYGKLFATIGVDIDRAGQVTRESVIAASEHAIGVVRALGKSDTGQKTMLDVLVPVLDALRTADEEQLPAAIRESARLAAEATIPMLALRGRASFLGERSRGHMDPGARSSELIVAAVCDFVERLREGANVRSRGELESTQ